LPLFRENKRAEIQTIGAGSLNQAMKALILARGYLKDDGFDVVFYPEFVDLDFDGRLVTAIKIIVEPR
jgi:stage V sporulation protein S